jgi:quercetin dioxygenase-like cupin family protein
VPFGALAHILDGEVEIGISGKKVYPNAGERVIMPANQPHTFKAIKRFKMILTMIKA